MCINHFSVRCSVIENDDSVAGWKVGSSVAYCETCFVERKFKKRMNLKESDERNELDEELCCSIEN